jgi:hypothetical protein
MALPADKTEWPPSELKPVYDQMSVYDAWLRGNPAEIGTSLSERITHLHNGVSYSGGLVGKIAPAFWGRPVEGGTKNVTRLHLPIAADLAGLSSDQLFAEPPTFRIAGEEEQIPDAQADRLDTIANSEAAAMMMNESGEMGATLGGTYYVADWDTANGPGHVVVRAVDADMGVPEYLGGRLVAVTFWTVYADDKFVWRHLVRHSVGMIEHALYKSDGSTIGHRRPLAEHPETRWLYALTGVGVASDDLSTVFQVPSTRLHVAYAPNVRKSRRFRKQGVLSEFGRSDFEGQLELFDALDETWSSLMRDLKQGAGHLFVNQALMQNNGPGMGASWDMRQEITTQLNSLPKVGSSPLLDQVQFKIRVDEHLAAAGAITKQIIRGAGWSLSTYDEYAGGGSGGARTATEITDLRRRSETTRDKKKRYQGQALSYINSVAMEMDAAIFPGKGGEVGLPIQSEFPAVSQVDPEAEARTIALLDGARSISTLMKVSRANPGRDDDWINGEVDRILEGEAIDDGADIT